MIISDFSTDPYGGRVVLLLYGPQKIGKTSTILKMAREQGQLVYIVSPDRGLFDVRNNPREYAGKILVSYPSSLRDVRNDIKTMKERIEKLVGKIGRERVWFVVDTVTELQDILLTEARKVDVSNPQLRKNEAKAQTEDDLYIRDLITQVDYFANMGHMSEVVHAALSMPCNVLFVALSKFERPEDRRDARKRDRPKVFPKISASTYDKVTGDCDAILYMDKASEGDGRVLYCTPSTEYLAGDRSGLLAETESPDLVAIRKKMLTPKDGGVAEEAATQAAT